MFIHKGATTAIRAFWLTTISFHCAYAEHRTAILQSYYHKNGPSSSKMAKNIQSILQNNLESIQNIQTQLDKHRESIIKTNMSGKEEQLSRQQPEKKKLLQDYYESYTSLMKNVAKCPINNDWIYKLIAWYNMVPFYKTLVERMINAKEQDELIELVGCLLQMKHQWNNPYGIIDQSIFKQNNLSLFYKRLAEFDLQIPTIRQIEKILIVPLNLPKRIFFNRYYNHKIDYFLKYLQVTESYTLNDVIWLMNAYVRAMNDDEQGISLLEKYLISHRPTLTGQDLTLLMKAYELKGRINKNIYEIIIKPYILKEKMDTIDNLIEMIRFTVCSESQDHLLLKNLYELITIKYKHKKIATSRHLYYLHLYTHYLRIKGYKIKLPAALDKELNRFCQQRAQGRQSINRLTQKALNGNELNQKNKKAKYKSPCLSIEGPQIIEYEQTQKSVFEKQFSHKLKLLNLSDYKIYEKPVFCCFELDYFLVHKLTTECLDIEIQGIQYVFASGRLTRERVIRDEILAHYNIKIKHLDYNYVKTKQRFDEDQLLMNKRLKFTRQ